MVAAQARRASGVVVGLGMASDRVVCDKVWLMSCSVGLAVARDQQPSREW